MQWVRGGAYVLAFLTFSQVWWVLLVHRAHLDYTASRFSKLRVHQNPLEGLFKTPKVSDSIGMG